MKRLTNRKKSNSLLNTYNRAPISFVKGKGVWLIDKKGERYLDIASGIAVNSLGHAHPRLIKALNNQATKLWHTSNLYNIPNQEKLAKLLVSQTFADKVFFTNSGAESIECAIKMARRYFFSIGEKTKIWHFCHILSNSKIGSNTSIGQNVVIGPNVNVGNNCKIQNNVSLYDGVIIEDDVFLGPSCVFTNVINPRAFVERKDEFQSTHIKKGASIGANATIICGVTIGEYSIVGAGSVVTKDVDPYSVVIGNPAKFYSMTSKEGDILDSKLVSKKTGKKYILKNGSIVEA